jgi:hypothetical protein
MTIDSATLMWSRRGGGQSVDESGRVFTVSFMRTYQVVHSADATDLEILSAVPALGSAFSEGSTSYIGVFLRNRSLTPGGPILTYVQCDYSGEIDLTTGDPTNAIPDINWVNAATDEPVDLDATGRPYTNVNGEIVGGQTKRINDFVLTVKRNFLTIDTYLISQYLDSTNSDLFSPPGGSWPAGTCAMESFNARPMGFVGGVVTYWEVTTSIACRVPFLTVPLRAWWKRYRNEGFYARSGALVSFSGGGGVGAAGYAVESGGVITAVVVTNTGRNYTSAPTVTITGAGSGATATAEIANEGVSAVTVTAGGSNYKSGLKRAVDNNKEPVSTPVLLKANGQQEPNLANAIYLERPDKQFYLPYMTLGLF